MDGARARAPAPHPEPVGATPRKTGQQPIDWERVIILPTRREFREKLGRVRRTAG